MKKLVIFLASGILAACSSSDPNLSYSNEPILNVEANLAPQIEAKAERNQAWVKNKSTQPLNVTYHLYWYDNLGVTQIWPIQAESRTGALLLQPNEKKSLDLSKPTSKSQNYRLYLQ